jgi:hypothetical protein
MMLVNGDQMINRRFQQNNVLATDPPSATPSSIPSSVFSQSSNKSGFPSQIPSDSPSSLALECGGRTGEIVLRIRIVVLNRVVRCQDNV